LETPFKNQSFDMLKNFLFRGGAGMWNGIPQNDSRNSGIPGMVFLSLEFSNPNYNIATYYIGFIPITKNIALVTLAS